MGFAYFAPISPRQNLEAKKTARAHELATLRPLIADYFQRLVQEPLPFSATEVPKHVESYIFYHPAKVFARYHQIPLRKLDVGALARAVQLALVGPLDFPSQIGLNENFRKALVNATKHAATLKVNHHVNWRRESLYGKVTRRPHNIPEKAREIEGFAKAWNEIADNPDAGFLSRGDRNALLSMYDSVNKISRHKLENHAPRIKSGSFMERIEYSRLALVLR